MTRVFSSYDVVRQFKKSAATHSTKSNHLHGVPQNGRLFQVITDKCDTESSFQNKKSLFQSLAAILTKNRECPSQMLIPHLKKKVMTVSLTELEEVNNSLFLHKKPPMFSAPEVNLNDYQNYFYQNYHQVSR